MEDSVRVEPIAEDVHPEAQEGLEHLDRIEEQLEAIKDRTANPRWSLINGIMQGIGVVIGTLIGLALLGWALSLLGIIPGLGTLVAYLHQLVGQLHK